MYELSVKTHFSAAHRLVGYAGQCANPHGHNWEVEIAVRGAQLNDLGILVDFRELKSAVREALQELDHCDLNSLPPFLKTNPTSENIARYLHERLSAKPISAGCRVSRVTVCETPGTAASYWEDTPDKGNG